MVALIVVASLIQGLQNLAGSKPQRPFVQKCSEKELVLLLNAPLLSRVRTQGRVPVPTDIFGLLHACRNLTLLARGQLLRIGAKARVCEC